MKGIIISISLIVLFSVLFVMVINQESNHNYRLEQNRMDAEILRLQLEFELNQWKQKHENPLQEKLADQFFSYENNLTFLDLFSNLSSKEKLPFMTENFSLMNQSFYIYKSFFPVENRYLMLDTNFLIVYWGNKIASLENEKKG